jgi:hypothetical protein
MMKRCALRAVWLIAAISALARPAHAHAEHDLAPPVPPLTEDAWDDEDPPPSAADDDEQEASDLDAPPSAAETTPALRAPASRTRSALALVATPASSEPPASSDAPAVAGPAAYAAMTDPPPVPAATAQAEGASSPPSAAGQASAHFSPAPPPSNEGTAGGRLPASPQPDAAPTPALEPAAIFPPAPPPLVQPEPAPAAPVPAPPPPPAAAAPSPPPSAAGPPAPGPEKLWNIGAAIGVGGTFDHTSGGVNPLGFGFGVRGEYRLHDEWSVGARALFFVGGSSDLPTGRVASSSWLLAVEGAYVIDFAPVLVQPGLALGIMQRDQRGPPVSTLANGSGFIPGSQSGTRTGLYVAPGATVTLPLGAISPQLDRVFVAADGRLDFVFGSRLSGNLQLSLLAGIRF